MGVCGPVGDLPIGTERNRPKARANLKPMELPKPRNRRRTCRKRVTAHSSVIAQKPAPVQSLCHLEGLHAPDMRQHSHPGDRGSARGWRPFRSSPGAVLYYRSPFCPLLVLTPASSGTQTPRPEGSCCGQYVSARAKSPGPVMFDGINRTDRKSYEQSCNFEVTASSGTRFVRRLRSRFRLVRDSQTYLQRRLQ